MQSLLTRLVLVAITAAAIFAAVAVPQDGRDAGTAQARVEQHAPKCIKLADYRRGLEKRVIRYRVVSGGNYLHYRIYGRGLHRTQKQRDCWRARGNLKRVKRMRKMQNERFQEWRFYRKINRLTPYGEWAIPSYIVSCESGGVYTKWNYGGSGASGAYQIMGGTWRAYGGGAFASAAAYAPPWAQHIIAHRIYSASGSGPWSCA